MDKEWGESVSPYYTILEILKIENIFKLKISLLVHKIKDGKRAIPTVSQELIISVSEIHKYNTRYAANQNLYRPASRINYGLARFKILSSQIWETISSEIKLCHTIVLINNLSFCLLPARYKFNQQHVLKYVTNMYILSFFFFSC